MPRDEKLAVNKQETSQGLHTAFITASLTSLGPLQNLQLKETQCGKLANPLSCQVGKALEA